MRLTILPAPLLVAPLLLAANAPQTAAPPAPMAGMAMPARAACPATPAPLPAALAGWKPGATIVAGSDEAVFPFLPLEARAEVRLADTAKVRYVMALKKPAPPMSKGGLLSFKVDRAGTYRVALGTAAWIEVIAGGKALASVAHAHGPECSGIRKMVDYALTPGAYVLQISESNVPATGVLVTRLP